MLGKRYQEILAKRAGKRTMATANKQVEKVAVVEGNTRRDWPHPDAVELDKLLKEVEENELTDSVWFYQHKVRCDLVTRHTQSGQICYWCITQECFFRRWRHHFKEIKRRGEKGAAQQHGQGEGN